MENASKALLMAGGVLMAILVVSMLVLMFSNLTGFFSEDNQANREAQIVKFNLEYESYNRDNIRGTDMLSLLAKVQDYNILQSDYRGVGAGYLPMTVEINIKNNSNEIDDDVKAFKFQTSDTQKINDKYTQSERNNAYEQIKKIKDDCVNELNNLVIKTKNPKAQISDNDLETLTSAITLMCDDIDTTNKVRAEIQQEKRYRLLKRIFLYEDNQNEKDRYLQRFENGWWKSQKATIRNNIKAYYQYTQFKKAYFYCSGNGRKGETGTSGVTYDKNTGRITKLTFYFDYIGE